MIPVLTKELTGRKAFQLTDASSVLGIQNLLQVALLVGGVMERELGSYYYKTEISLTELQRDKSRFSAMY